MCGLFIYVVYIYMWFAGAVTHDICAISIYICAISIYICAISIYVA